MSEIVPVLSSSVVGPLGIKHLPRLWLKILLHACGKLPEGYRHGSGGFDEALTDVFGIDNAAFVAYIEREKPSYLQLEDWVRRHATKLDAATIDTFNERVRTATLRPELLAERRTRFGLADSFTNAVALNDLDDWAGLHERLVAANPAAAT